MSFQLRPPAVAELCDAANLFLPKLEPRYSFAFVAAPTPAFATLPFAGLRLLRRPCGLRLRPPLRLQPRFRGLAVLPSMPCGLVGFHGYQ